MHNLHPLHFSSVTLAAAYTVVFPPYFRLAVKVVPLNSSSGLFDYFRAFFHQLGHFFIFALQDIVKGNGVVPEATNLPPPNLSCIDSLSASKETRSAIPINPPGIAMLVDSSVPPTSMAMRVSAGVGVCLIIQHDGGNIFPSEP